MKFYIVEDDLNIVRILRQIIADCDLGSVEGNAVDGETALREIPVIKPDVVLVDLFIPKVDGINLVKQLPMTIPSIMISQVTAKDMISKAYEAGVHFYIQKPINAVEVRSVIERLGHHVKTLKKLDTIQSLFSDEIPTKESSTPRTDEDYIQSVLQQLGILGESGADAILQSVSFLLNHEHALNEMTLKEFFSQFSDQPKSFEQRIRRTATVALSNLSHIGLEDYMNPLFQEYAHSLFPFREIRMEMEWIKGTQGQRGKVNIRKFLEGVAYHSKNE